MRIYICVLKSRDYVAFNGMYMRPLRRIAGDPRFSGNTTYTGIQIRALLKAPSVDCIVSRMRLDYLGRVARSGHRVLLGMLHLRAGKKRLPWVTEVAKDCDRLLERGVLHP